MNMSRYAPTYLLTLLITVIACGMLSFGFNALVDPMWYFGGNKAGNVNYAFNERLSKMNRFLATQDNYDCVIFGDSRVTLLPEKYIEGYRCYNFAFSAGKAEEAVSYARYISERGFNPRLVIMGVPAAAFRERIGGANIPSFIRENENPKPALIAYLSIDAVSMSWQTLSGQSPLDRIYDPDFTCRVAPGAPDYDPAVPVRDLMAGRFIATERTRFYDEMRAIFPQAEMLGYVPPISAWAIRAYNREGWLDDYLNALHKAAQSFDRFLDYGVPSSLTMDVHNTYDGTHYSEPANKLIAETLFSGESAIAIDLEDHSLPEIKNIYAERLTRYEVEIQAGLSAFSNARR